MRCQRGNRNSPRKLAWDTLMFARCGESHVPPCGSACDGRSCSTVHRLLNVSTKRFCLGAWRSEISARMVGGDGQQLGNRVLVSAREGLAALTSLRQKVWARVLGVAGWMPIRVTSRPSAPGPNHAIGRMRTRQADTPRAASFPARAEAVPRSMTFDGQAHLSSRPPFGLSGTRQRFSFSFLLKRSR